MLPADQRCCDGSKGGVAIEEVDGTMTNRVRLGGHVMVPNLDYKKDAFLESSLISNFLSNTSITTTSTTMSPTCHTNKQVCRQPASTISSPSSSNGSVAWSNSFLRGGIQNLQEYRTPQGEVLSRPNQQLANLMNGTCYPTPSCQSHSTLRLPTCYEHLLALSNPCWTLPVGCSLVHRGRIESTINLYPAKGKAMAMSAATTSLEWPD